MQKFTQSGINKSRFSVQGESHSSILTVSLKNLLIDKYSNITTCINATNNIDTCYIRFIEDFTVNGYTLYTHIVENGQLKFSLIKGNIIEVSEVLFEEIEDYLFSN